ERVNVDSTGHLNEDLQRELTYGLLQRLANLGIGHLAPPTPCCRFDGYDYLTATQAGLSWAEPAPIGGSSSPAGSPVWRPS
ncbi:MAG: hypothetical protein VX290_05875, partial [Candidatus Latescibacterota bacterium]|nr:hypothetical protein [Candidatus Latescibacterota bacterium]